MVVVATHELDMGLRTALSKGAGDQWMMGL